jgi:dihydrofolate synthase/folylpolyglutamate synthase
MALVTSPGRLEVVRTGPLVVLDGAHNQQAFAALETTLGEEFAGRAWVLVLGMMGDKDRAAMVEELDSSRFAAVVTTAAEGARPVSPEEVSATLREVWGERIPVEMVAGAKNAIERALELAADQGSVLVTGSLYLVGEVRTALGLT